MAPTIFTGALMPKKKSELQEISLALRISDQGTKDEILNRIKKHLERNPGLEDEPAFAGLFANKRKKSIQPQTVIPSSRLAPSETVKPISANRSLGRRVTALDPVRESTPNGELRDVSMFLKQPVSPVDSTPDLSPRQITSMTPSLPPLPPSPAKTLIEYIPKPLDVEAIATRIKDTEALINSMEMLDRLRRFLSNSRNIWSLTALAEILYILQTIIPWETMQIPLNTKGHTSISISIRYPPWGVFQTYAFWMVLLHWAVPTLIIPSIIGNLISFNSRSPQSRATSSVTPIYATPFDPLSASIIRLAAHVGYPFSVLDNDVHGIDVLGFRWRVLNAAVGLAFAFAEAIAGAPQTFAKTLVTEHQYKGLLESQNLSIKRQALMSADSSGEEEIE